MQVTAKKLLLLEQVTRLSERNRAVGWGLQATYAVHLMFIGKHVVDFTLVIIELFAICYGRGTMSEYRVEVGVFERGWLIAPKI